MTSPVFTLPPATRAAGTGNPPLDMDAAINALLAMGVALSVRSTAFSGGAKCDVRDLTAVAISSGQPTLTCAGGNFTSADVGKVAYVYGAGASGGPLITTVSSFTNSTTIVLAANASTTVASGNAFVGTDDAAAWNAALAAVPSNGGIVLMAPGASSYCGSTLTVGVSGTIIAGGGSGSQIRYSGSTATPLLKATSTSTLVRLRDMRLSQVDAASAGTTIDASNFANAEIERVVIDAGGGSGAPPLIGIDHNGTNCHYNVVRDCKVTFGGTGGMGIAVRGLSHSNTLDNPHVSSGAGADTTSSSIYVANAHSTTMIHPDTEHAAGNGIFLDTGADATTIVNPYLEANNINLKISSGVNNPVVVGGTIETGTVANIQDNGSVNPVILAAWANPGSTTELPGAGAPQAADQALIAWSYDQAEGVSNSTAPSAGVVQLVRVIIRAPATVTNVILHVATAGSTLTAGQNFAGLYNSSGTLLSATADQTTPWGSTGLKTMALTVAQAVNPGTYYVGFVSNGTTPPAFARSGGLTAESSLLNAGLAVASARFATNGSGVTTLANVTMGSNSFASVGFWAAVS